MKNLKKQTQKFIISVLITSTFFLGLIYVCEQSIIKMTAFWTDFLVMHTDNFEIKIKQVKSEDKEKVYAYNEKVPIDIVKEEIKKQANLYGVDEKLALNLADCESDFDNLADNEKSTAKGVFQFVANTWEATRSNRDKISEFDYKANIKEAMLKLSNKEYSHWADCLK